MVFARLFKVAINSLAFVVGLGVALSVLAVVVVVAKDALGW